MRLNSHNRKKLGWNRSIGDSIGPLARFRPRRSHYIWSDIHTLDLYQLMPLTTFAALPSSARVWVFACDRNLSSDEARPLLTQADAYLAQWKAHGAPLRSAREWVHHRFLVVGIDPTAEQASGCSIDGLFRSLREIGRSVGTQLLGGGRVFFRDANGEVQSSSRAEFSALAARGDVTADTTVFDTTVIVADDWRQRFEQRAGAGWTAELLGAS